jgi:hypothetical protein
MIDKAKQPVDDFVERIQASERMQATILRKQMESCEKEIWAGLAFRMRGWFAKLAKSMNMKNW